MKTNGKEFERAEARQKSTAPDAEHMCRRLAALLGDDPGEDAAAPLLIPGPPTISPPKLSSRQAAQAIFSGRRLRTSYFPPSLFAEPAWDLLLALFIADQPDDTQSVTHLSEQIGSPLTSSLRWLRYLEDVGFIERTKSQSDRRKIFIALSEKGRNAMIHYLSDLTPCLSDPHE